MKKHDYLIIAVLIAMFAWWTRYDVYCTERPACVAYDRFMGEWINPALLARNTANENVVKALIVSTNSKMDYKKALLHGWSYQEIIDELRK